MKTAALAVLAIVAADARAAAPPHYATTRALEADRCATAWVIRRFVRGDAVISFHDRERMPPGVILFDLPESELRRDATRSTVEVLVQQEHVTDPFVLRLARLVHDIEITAWATRREPGSRELEAELGDAFTAAGSPEAGLEACFRILDRMRAADR